jgi:CRP/FNR family transcriptional regulator, anaerobic regulatory protein
MSAHPTVEMHPAAQPDETRVNGTGIQFGMPRTEQTCLGCDVRSLSVCGALSEAELDQLNAMATTASYVAGQTILMQGEPADYMFNVTSGTLRITMMLADGRRQVIGFMLPGDFLGLALTDTYRFGAEAVTDVQLCRFPRSRFAGLLDQLPHFQKRLHSFASNELLAAQDHMMLLGRLTAEERIASFLLLMSRRLQRCGASANPIHLPMTRADIADHLGLTMETVSRTLTKLKRDGAVLVAGSTVSLQDVAALEATAGR